MNFEQYLEEAIKGWKHAHNDLAKLRAGAKTAGHEWHTHALKKDGKESGMHDARKSHPSEEAAREHVARLRKNNPGKHMDHNLYHKTTLIGKI